MQSATEKRAYNRLMNFVERRKCRETRLTTASELWDDARTKIEECCESFKKHYRTIGELDCAPINGGSLKIKLTFTGGKHPSPPEVIHATRIVRILFNESKPSISVTVDRDPVKEFVIDANEDHCFLKNGATEIDLEKFADLALNNAFFVLPLADDPV